MTTNEPMTHFVYQRIHVLGGAALRLTDHLRVAARACEHIYGGRPELDDREVASRIAGVLGPGHPGSGPGTGATVILRLVWNDGYEAEVEFERGLLEAGYSLSPLRPRTVSYEYSIPFSGFPTGFHLSARDLFDTLALRQHGATRSVRRHGDRLISCGDAPLFGIRGRVLFTAPLTEGAMDGVEREMVISAAGQCRMNVREEPILHGDLKSFDELFFADAAGITSISECDGAKFMSLFVERLVERLKIEN
jgi:hypothetical protein